MLFTLLILGALIYMASRVDTPKETTDKCPLHSWYYDETGFLICEKCKKRPGYSGRE